MSDDESTSLGRHPAPAAGPLTDTTLAGRFEIQGRIGGGAQAHVYLAWDKVFNHQVALKLLREDHLSNWRLRARLRREGQACRRIDSPHVLSVHEADFDADQPYLVTRYYPSHETLQELLQRRTDGLDEKECRRLLAEITDGMAAAHAVGVIHRDLKPANILVTKHPTGGARALVLDFGIAHDEEAVTTLTEERVGYHGPGTVQYMPPELFREGNPGAEDDERRDVFALGVLAYDMLLGRERPRLETQLTALRNGEPLRRLDDATRHSLKRKRIPRAFADVIARAVGPFEERYKNGGAMLEALREVDRLEATTVCEGMVLGGRYRLEEQIGEGGFARVFRAHAFDRPKNDADVAVKILSGDKDGCEEDHDTVRARFRREAQILIESRHDSVVRILDVGDSAELPYMVMERVRGIELGQRAPSLEWSDLLRLLGQVANAIDYVNAREVYHRDVKPENILVTEGGRAVLIDFGIAKIPSVNRLTATNVAIGTPGAMAPELADVTSESLASEEWRGDQWALAATIYRLLAGFPPDRRSPNYKPIATIRPDAPSPICVVLERALTINPAERFDSAQEFIDVLTGVSAKVELQMADASTIVPVTWSAMEHGAHDAHQEPPPRGRSRWAAVAVAIALACGGLGVAGGMYIAGEGDARPTTPLASSEIVDAETPGTAVSANVEPGRDAAPSDARPPTTVQLAIATLSGRNKKAGVLLRVDGESMKSPAVIARRPGAQVEVAVVDARYRTDRQTFTVPPGGGERVLELRRRSTSREQDDTRGDKEPDVYVPKVHRVRERDAGTN